VAATEPDHQECGHQQKRNHARQGTGAKRRQHCAASQAAPCNRDIPGRDEYRLCDISGLAGSVCGRILVQRSGAAEAKPPRFDARIHHEWRRLPEEHGCAGEAKHGDAHQCEFSQPLVNEGSDDPDAGKSAHAEDEQCRMRLPQAFLHSGFRAVLRLGGSPPGPGVRPARKPPCRPARPSVPHSPRA
jgi:hypothetical protein